MLDFVDRTPFVGLLAALASTLLLTPAARGLARRLGVVDRPDGQRKLQRRPVALLGGVALSLGFVLGIAALFCRSSLSQSGARLPAVLAGLTLLCLVGVWDDVWNLRPRWKLAGQILAALPVAWAGFAIERIGVRGHILELGPCAIPFTVLWLVVGINALNLIDGMDGLASTTGMCIALGIAATGWVTGANETALLALALAGSLGGFLAYNFPPASIYLGDAGSMVIGLVLATLSLEVAKDSLECTSLPVMLVLMAVPLEDTGLAILRRWLSGKGIFYADRGHIHHRLLDQGFSTRRVLAIVAAICLLTGAVVVLARTVDWDGAAWVACALLAAALIRARLMGYHEWAMVKQAARARLAVPQLPAAEEIPLPVPGLRLYVGDSSELTTEDSTADVPPATAVPAPARRAA